MAARYPLDPLMRLRGERVAEEKVALGSAHDEARAAAATLASAARALEAAAERARMITDAEDARLRGGELRAGDLLRGAAWALGVEAGRIAHDGAVAVAREGEAQALAGVDAARASLADARARAEVVERHRDAWHAEGARRAEAAAELEADDVHGARRARGTP